jgi:preprotein translocase subunit YajC
MPQTSFLVQIMPFALMLVIFYLLVLMPMRKKQQKVKEFQAGLKVGDRVITTSGIYGQVTKLSDASVKIQIADKVQIEVSRATIGGYQGQEPVVQAQDAGSSV